MTHQTDLNVQLRCDMGMLLDLTKVQQDLVSVSIGLDISLAVLNLVASHTSMANKPEMVTISDASTVFLLQFDDVNTEYHF